MPLVLKKSSHLMVLSLLIASSFSLVDLSPLLLLFSLVVDVAEEEEEREGGVHIEV